MSEQKTSEGTIPTSFKDRFSQDQWKTTKDKIYMLSSHNEEETIPDIVRILNFLQELNASKNYDEFFGDKAIKNWFFNEFFATTAKNFINTRVFNSKEVLKMVNQIFEEMLLFWMKAMPEDNVKLAEMARVLIDPARAYYKTNDQEEITASSLAAFMREPSKEQVEWVASLKQGDLVDCLKIESTHKKITWSRAKVLHVLDSHLKIGFLNEKETFNRYLDKTVSVNEIMPFKSKTPDYEWRLGIKIGDIIDVCDTSNVWYNSTVLDINTEEIDGMEVKSVLVGYRVFDEDGDKIDQEGRRFSGWSSRYDEWLTVTNPRIQPRNRMAKKLYMASSSSNDDPQIEDSNDTIYNLDVNQQRIYCITRQGYCRSVFLINLLNKLGNMGLFDKILERISDKTKWAPIDIVSIYSGLVGNCHSVFHREFALEYIPKLKKAAWESVLKSPDSNIRNFSKEKIESITNAFDLLLKRVYSIPEKQEMIETFNLEISLMCFETDFLERKLQGIKSILDIIKQIKYGNTKFLTNAYLNNVIKKYEIFDKIYGKRGHVSMIQRSADFLKHMISENAVEQDQFELVWSSTQKGDKEAKLAVYKVLSDIALHFKAEHLEFLIAKISEIPPSEIIPEEIDLVYELGRYSVRPVAFVKKTCDFYWNIITEAKPSSSSNISDLALNRFCDIMKGWELREERFQVLLDCIENIEKEVSVLSSIKIMKKLIDTYPSSPTATEQYTKTTCLDHLVSEKGLLKTLIHNLKEFKAKIKSKLPADYAEEDLDKITGDNNTYVTHIAERLAFIHFVLSNSSSEVNLTFNLLRDIWDTVVNNSFTKAERDVLYKWLKDSTESKATFPMSIEDLIQFFKEKMTDDEESKRMTSEGFKCFRNIFLLINEKLGKLVKGATSSTSDEKASYSTTYTDVNGTIYASYSYNYEDRKKNAEGDFEFKTLVFPSQLEGINSIWEVILQTDNEEVIEKALEFLNKLYTSVGEELESKNVELNHEFLNNCIKKLNHILAHRDSYSEQALTKSILRCLLLIKSLMDESEKKGVGNLKSHSSLVKGELLSFSVTNDITSGSTVPKKVELRVYSNITVYELRVEIAKQIQASWDQVKLLRYQTKEIKDNENGKTLGDIRIRNGETLTAAKRPTPPIPQANLLMPDGSMNPAAKKIFIDWFEMFSENGKMSPDGCAAFIHSCTNDNCQGDDRRVKEVFAQYDSDRDGFLTQDNFLEFYYSACKQRSHVVWNNLASHHYRNDLKKPSEIEEEKVDVKNLPRYFISTSEEYFKMIFSLLDYGGKIAIEAWNLLNRLPTSPEIFKVIIQLEGVRGQQKKNWDLILDSNSIYKLLYTLHVIEFLMEDENEKDAGEESVLDFFGKDDPKFQEYKKQWRSDFIENGGFEHLFQIFNQTTKKGTSSLSIFDKNVLSFILKILKNYLTATFAKKVPGLYRNLSFIRLFHLSLDFIHDYIKTEGKSNELVSEDPNLEKKGSTADDATAQLPENKRKQSKDDTKKKEAEERKKEKLKIEETPDFLVLVEKLSGDLGHHILSTINFKDMVKLCVTQGLELLNKPTDLESEDRLILEYSISILAAILLYDNSLIDYLFNIDNSPEKLSNGKEYLLEGIFCSKSLNIRKYFSHAFYIVSKETLHYKNGFLSKYIIKLCLENLPDTKSDKRADCNQYFELLCKLIEETYQSKGDKEEEDDKSLNFDFLLESTVTQLKAHNSTEKRSGTTVNDKILIGFLNLCQKILQVKPHLRDLVGDPEKHNLVHEIFASCLFDIADRETNFPHYSEGVDATNFSRDYVKCKGRDSRVIAYKLLGTLCRGHERNLNVLLNDLLALVGKIPVANSWNYHPSGDAKSLWGYVGLKNLGCICYMNSMLQQFYMTPTFRYAVMMADDKKEPNLVNKDNKYMIDDNVLHQLQKMFGFLELSDRQDYNPHEFCFAFKDFQGNPVNVSIQQDAQEFLNMIFDKLETGLKNTPFRHILDSVYGGKTCQQLICAGCGHVKSREETFYNLSLEVKNMKTIHDSLEKFITGEVIDDYFCDNCKKKVSTTKRTCIAQPPNVMIVHLQRIIFDWEAMVNMKVNSRLEFPHELNIEPYTQDGLEWREKQKAREKKAKGGAAEEKADEQPKKEQEDGDQKEKEAEIQSSEKDGKEQTAEDEEPLGPYMKHPKEYYEYRLAGIVVHIGTADFGHYYSYINTNRGDPRKQGANTKNKWLEFNDSTIRDFDVKNIESECFGGASSDSGDDSWGWGKAGRDNSKNAYILVYERVVKDSVKMIVHEETESKFLDTYLGLKNPENSANHKIYDVVPQPDEKDAKEHKVYEVDYYAVKKFVPSAAYKKVWEDNHKFMFERHLYNEDFFKFIREVSNAIKMPELTSQNVTNYIYQGYKEIPENSKQSYLTIIKILANLIYSLLARANDNSQIGEICNAMKQLMTIVPESAYEFFEKIVLKDIKYTVELILTCPSQTVRSNLSQVILHAINVIISFYGFDLSLKKFEGKEEEIEKSTEKGPLEIEYKVVSFLNMLLNIMPVDVAKSWTKFGQYFEFWRDFALAGTPQVRYLYQKQMVAYLIDFYLEKRSPLGNEISEHKHSMGNRYTNPEFDPLIQTLAILIRRSKRVSVGKVPKTCLTHLEQFDLSVNDNKCLDSADFFEKTMAEKYDPQAFGVLIEHFSFENEHFSYQMAILILRGLNKCNYDETKPYLEAITYFLNIKDSFQMKRIEWILGYPQPVIQNTKNGLPSFGMYGNNSIDDVVINYQSTVNYENCFSLLHIIITNRRRLENLCLVCLRQLLLICELNPVVFEYLSSMPPPSYNYANFTDWVRPFIENYIADAKRYYYGGYPKEEAGNEALKFFNLYEEKLAKKIQFNQETICKFRGTKTEKPETVVTTEKQAEDTAENKEKPAEAKPTVLKSVLPVYVIGETKSQEKTKEIQLIDSTPGVTIVENQNYVYLKESLPTGSTNLAFPSEVVKESYISSHQVKPGSALAHFIVPMHSAQSDATQAADPKDLESQENAKTQETENNKEETGIEVVNEEGKIETIEDTENAFVYELNPMVRRYIAVNSTLDQFHVSLTIVPKAEGFLNFRVPASTFNFILRPNSAWDLVTLVKIFPEVDWGDYEFKYIITKLENPGGNRPPAADDQNKGTPTKPLFNIRKIDVSGIGNEDIRRCEKCGSVNSASNYLCIDCHHDFLN